MISFAAYESFIDNEVMIQAKEGVIKLSTKNPTGSFKLYQYYFAHAGELVYQPVNILKWMYLFHNLVSNLKKSFEHAFILFNVIVCRRNWLLSRVFPCPERETTRA